MRFCRVPPARTPLTASREKSTGGVPESSSTYFSTSAIAREVEILRLVAHGDSNAEIAQSLHLSRATVKSHVASILAKLDLRDRTQAAVFAYECGFVRPGMGDY